MEGMVKTMMQSKATKHGLYNAKNLVGRPTKNVNAFVEPMNYLVTSLCF